MMRLVYTHIYQGGTLHVCRRVWQGIAKTRRNGQKSTCASSYMCTKRLVGCLWCAVTGLPRSIYRRIQANQIQIQVLD